MSLEVISGKRLGRRGDKRLVVCQCKAPPVGEAYFPWGLIVGAGFDADSLAGWGNWNYGSPFAALQGSVALPVQYAWHDPAWDSPAAVPIGHLNGYGLGSFSDTDDCQADWGCSKHPHHSGVTDVGDSTGAGFSGRYGYTNAAVTREGDDLVIKALWAFSYGADGLIYNVSGLCGLDIQDALRNKYPYCLKVTQAEVDAAFAPAPNGQKCQTWWMKKFARMCRGYVSFTMRSVGCKVTAAELAAMSGGQTASLLCRIKRYPMQVTLETDMPDWREAPPAGVRSSIAYSGVVPHGGGFAATTRRFGFWNGTWNWTAFDTYSGTSFATCVGFNAFANLSGIGNTLMYAVLPLLQIGPTVLCAGNYYWNEYAARCVRQATGPYGRTQIMDYGAESIDYLFEQSVEKRRTQFILTAEDFCCSRFRNVIHWMMQSSVWNNMVIRVRKTTRANYASVSVFDNVGWTTVFSSGVLHSLLESGVWWTWMTITAPSPSWRNTNIEFCVTWDNDGLGASPGAGIVTGWDTLETKRALYASAAFGDGADDPLTWTAGDWAVSAIRKTGKLPRLMNSGS